MTGRILDGIRLKKRIGGGNFGSVYISEDRQWCAKLIFPARFQKLDAYQRELRAVRFITSCIPAAGKLIYFLCGRHWRNNEDGTVTPISEEDSLVDPNVFFAYFMTAADSAGKSAYTPMTLCKMLHNEMTHEQKMRAVGELLDGLLYLYSDVWYGSKHVKLIHGDIKPENVLFVGGHAVFGDFGSTFRIDENDAPRWDTAYFRRPRSVSEPFNGYSSLILNDLYALGKTVKLIDGNGKELKGFTWNDQKLFELAGKLCSFADYAKSDNEHALINSLRKLRAEFSLEQYCVPPMLLLRPASVIELDSMEKFHEIWYRMRQQTDTRMKVTNPDTIKRPDSYSAMHAIEYREDELNNVLKDDHEAMQRADIEQKPVVIYHCKKEKVLEVLFQKKIICRNPRHQLPAFQMAYRDAARGLRPEITIRKNGLTFHKTVTLDFNFPPELDAAIHDTLITCGPPIWICSVTFPLTLTFVRYASRILPLNREQWQCGSGRNMPPEKMFSLILVLNNSFNRFRNGENAIREISLMIQRLKPGGFLLMETGIPRDQHGFVSEKYSLFYQTSRDENLISCGADKDWFRSHFGNIPCVDLSFIDKPGSSFEFYVLLRKS